VSKLTEAELELAKARRAASNQIKVLFESARTAMLQIQSIRESLTLAEKSYQQQNHDYRLGLATNLDVLQSFNAVTEAKRSLNRTTYQGKTAYAELQILSGKDL
jgi:outer membrane protein TolC